MVQNERLEQLQRHLLGKPALMKLESRVNYDAACRVFCGSSGVVRWHCPDHTKIENFRNRLSPETQRKLIDLKTSKYSMMSEGYRKFAYPVNKGSHFYVEGEKEQFKMTTNILSVFNV